MNMNKMALTAAHLNEESVCVLYTQQYLFYTQQYHPVCSTLNTTTLSALHSTLLPCVLYTQQYQPVCSTLNSTSLYALHSTVPACMLYTQQYQPVCSTLNSTTLQNLGKGDNSFSLGQTVQWVE